MSEFATNENQEALRSISDHLIEVRQYAADHNMKFLAYLIEMAILETIELQGHSREDVAPLPCTGQADARELRDA